MDNQKLPEEFKKKWIEALRSGKYKQGRANLFVHSDDDYYCCLGVACLLSGVPKESMDECCYPTFTSVPEIIRGRTENKVVAKLAEMNDGDMITLEGRKTFSEIADYIEQNL